MTKNIDWLLEFPGMKQLRLRLYGRVNGAGPQAGVPLGVSWEAAFDRLALLPRMFAEPDGSFLWSGDDATVGAWQLEGTLFDDGQVVRRIELAGNCSQANWEKFLQALDCDWTSVSVESLDDNCTFAGDWLRSQALDAQPPNADAPDITDS